MLCLGILVVGYSNFASSVTLKPDHTRASTIQVPAEIQKIIDEDLREGNLEGMPTSRYVNDLLRACTTFGMHNDSQKMSFNCVGHASIFTNAFNYINIKLNRKERATQVVGSVHIYKYDLCKILPHLVDERYKNFVKDHDFVEIDNGSFKIYVDPSFYVVFEE